jgi:hypothetical protein
LIYVVAEKAKVKSPLAVTIGVGAGLFLIGLIIHQNQDNTK